MTQEDAGTPGRELKQSPGKVEQDMLALALSRLLPSCNAPTGNLPATRPERKPRDQSLLGILYGSCPSYFALVPPPIHFPFAPERSDGETMKRLFLVLFACGAAGRFGATEKPITSFLTHQGSTSLHG